MKRQPIQSKNSAISQTKGFTLIELIVALVILGILLAAGIPGMQSLSDNMAVRTTSDRLINTLAYARGEAVARVDDIQICPSGNGSACNATTDADGNAVAPNWSAGWIVMGSDGTVMRFVTNADSSTIISGGPVSISFDEQGLNTSGVVNFTVAKNDASSRQVSVSVIGTTSVSVL